MSEALNVYGRPLAVCSSDPLTGYFRDGKCRGCSEDLGQHTVCVHLTEEFLEYTRSQGNDLSTPMPQYGFPGLKPGDRWCVCLSRWHEARKNGVEAALDLEATHFSVLEYFTIEDLENFDHRLPRFQQGQDSKNI